MSNDTAATVTVACKVPNGLILRLGTMETSPVPILGGGTRSEKRWRYDGAQVRINGPKRAVEGGDPSSPIANGYALTFGVPSEFMKRWMADNKDSDIVQKGLIVVHEKRDELKAMTAEHRDTRTGLEPMAQDDDKRIPKPSKIEKMER